MNEDCEPILRLARKAFLLGLDREDPAWASAVSKAIFWIESSTDLYGRPTETFNHADVFAIYSALPYKTKDIEEFQNLLSPHDPRYFAIQLRARLSGELRELATRALNNRRGFSDNENLTAINGLLNDYVVLTTPIPTYQQFINTIKNQNPQSARFLTSQHPKLLETFVIRAMKGDVNTIPLERLAQTVFGILNTNIDVFQQRVLKHVPFDEWAGILTLAKDVDPWAYRTLGNLLKLESPEICATTEEMETQHVV